jgi:hypothetical protein
MLLLAPLTFPEVIFWDSRLLTISNLLHRYLMVLKRNLLLRGRMLRRLLSSIHS